MNPWEVETLMQRKVNDPWREMQRYRMVRQYTQARGRVDLRCWLESRRYYIAALVDHWVRRVRHALPAGERVPAPADCR